MRNVLWVVCGMMAALMMSGCATTDQRVMALQTENDALKKDVQEKTVQIGSLTQDKARLENELSYCNRRAEVLVKEKSARLDEASVLRKGVREFTEQVMKSLQTYFQRAEIVDYLGNELFARANADSQQKVLLVDLANPALENGTIIGGRAWLNAPGKLHFCLLRLDTASGKYSVVAMSPEIDAAAAGLQTWVFDLPMAARKGDLVGVYLPENVVISYDDVDTGQVVAVPGSVKVNDTVSVVPGDARNKRTYSFGVVGYFDTPGNGVKAAEGAAAAAAP